jgi:hypothetical protein
MSFSKQNRRWFLGLTLTLIGILMPASPPYLLCMRLSSSLDNVRRTVQPEVTPRKSAECGISKLRFCEGPQQFPLRVAFGMPPPFDKNLRFRGLLRDDNQNMTAGGWSVRRAEEFHFRSQKALTLKSMI